MIRKLFLLSCVLGLGAIGCGGDEIAPRVTIQGPDNGLFTVNRWVNVDVTVTEEERLDFVTLSVDGVEVDRALPEEICREEEPRCSMTLEWFDVDFADGVHILTVSAVDAAGNVGEAIRDVELGTGVGVDRIWFTNMPEDLLGDPSLEVEVALRDAATNQLIGCTGGEQGMAKVDSDDVDYDNVSAFFISPTQSGAILAEDLADMTLVAIVSEDDDEVCPAAETSDSETVLGSDDDDFLGRTPEFSGAELVDGLTFEDFDDVRVLNVSAGRFFTHHNE